MPPDLVMVGVVVLEVMTMMEVVMVEVGRRGMLLTVVVLEMAVVVAVMMVVVLTGLEGTLAHLSM